MVCSIAVHLALFAIADGLLSKWASPSTTSTPLLVSILHPRISDDLADDQRAVPEAGNESANSGRVEHANRTSATSSDAAEATALPAVAAVSSPRPDLAAEVTRSADQAVVARPEPVVETSIVPDQGVEDVARSVIVATTRIDEPVVTNPVSTSERPRQAQAALLPSQKEMLEAKVRKWTEDLHEMSDVAAGLIWEYKGQEYRAEFTDLPAADDMGIQRVTVEISTQEDGRRLTSAVQMKRLAFSNYAKFVNRWDPSVELHDDELDGRFHSNTRFNLNHDRKGQPLFRGMVTTASRSVSFTSGRTKRDEIFAGGLQTGVKSIRLPKQHLLFADEEAFAGDQVHRFDEDTRITFRDDGSYAWQAIDSDSPQQVAALSEGTTYLVANGRVRLHVKGTVNGKVLVYSPERIVIEDDLVYAQHPEVVPDADDNLGLISDKSVHIAPARITGPGNLLINAAIYAKRRFAVRGHRSRENAMLYLYGSLSVGSISATEPRYYTRIQFDKRFEETRPPGFPMTDRYEVESWDAEWMVEAID